MKKVLVTGGSGFIGTNLVERYRAAGHDVLNIDLAPPRCEQHSQLWRRVDLLDRRALGREIERFRPQIVFHMAARTDLAGRSEDDYSANTVGVRNLIECLSHSDVELVVFASSMLVCRIGYQPRDEQDYCPSTHYGQSKVDGERIVREMAGSFPWVIVRPTSIWGPWFRTPYRDFFEMVRRGMYFHPKGSTVFRSYGYVGNAVHCLEALSERRGGELLGRTIYLADFAPLEIRSWAEAIAREFDAAPVRQLPVSMFRLAALAGDALGFLGVRAPITTFRLRNMLTEVVFDLGPLRTVCAVLPYTVDEGVRLTCEWMRRSP